MMAYKFKNGAPELIRDVGHRLTIKDGKGTSADIDYKSPSEPNEGLGYNLSPDEDREPQFKEVEEKSSELCKSVSSSYMLEEEAHHAMNG
ncbi:hypothetical protein ACHAWF_004181 [Thalassiosira exigua]